MAEEARVEEALREAVEAVGGLCLKLPASLYRGVPDRLLVLPGGRVFFVELKDRRGKTNTRTRVHQEWFRDRLFSLGVPWYKIKGKPELQDFIKSHLGDPLC